MKSAHGRSAHGIALFGAVLGARLLEMLRARQALTDEEVRNLVHAAEADVRGLNTVSGTEAASMLSALLESVSGQGSAQGAGADDDRLAGGDMGNAPD